MMNIKTFLVVAVVAMSSGSMAQSWSSLEGGFTLYENTKSKSVTRDDDSNGSVQALVVFNGELYAGGLFKFAGNKPANNIAKWNGETWSPLGEGIDGMVSSLCVYKDELYAGGTFSMAGNRIIKNIAKWNGSSWTPLQTGLDLDARAMIVYKGELYVGGSFLHAGDKAASHIAKWDGTTWSSVSTGTKNDIYTLTELNGQLFAGGAVVQGKDDESNVSKWNGLKWTDVVYTDGAVSSLVAHNGKLCVGGSFTIAGEHDAIGVAINNGSIWSPLGKGLGYSVPQDYVNALFSYNGILYAGGDFKSTTIRGANGIAKWDGKSWTAMASGVEGYVSAFALYEGSLYVGGTFVKAGSSIANGIAKWPLLAIAQKETAKK